MGREERLRRREEARRRVHRQRRIAAAAVLGIARRHKALLVLDIQPGRSDFMTEAKLLRRFVEQPDVSLRSTPSGRWARARSPGRQIGSTTAADVNALARWMSGIVEREGLPQKLLVVHRFTKSMIRNEQRLKRYPGVAITVNVDGFGTRAQKVAKYREFTRDYKRRLNGFKLFHKEDTGLMKPRAGAQAEAAAGLRRLRAARWLRLP